MRGGLGELMKQAQQLQEGMRKAQEELATLEVSGQAGGRRVTVTMSGKHEVRRVHIDPQVLAGDPEMLEDLIAAATNDAVQKVESALRERFAGLGLPAGLKLPF